MIERGCQFAVKNHAGWTALDYSYSMELKAHLQGNNSNYFRILKYLHMSYKYYVFLYYSYSECARTHFEEKKKNKKRNQHLKIKVDSLISLDSVPLISSTRSATLPLSGVTYNSDNDNNNYDKGNNNSNNNNYSNSESIGWGGNWESESNRNNKELSSSIPNDPLSLNSDFNLIRRKESLPW